jgi:3-hydroxyethyl bacteriochlorophyllide a dehydrogenase
MAHAACVSNEPIRADCAPRALRGRAVVLEAPGKLAIQTLDLVTPAATDLVVDVRWSGISTGTERLLYTGTMPSFPGLAYPLVPGYEAVETVRWAGADTCIPVGASVFVPGARCYQQVAGLFGGAAERLVVPAARAIPLPTCAGLAPGAEFTLLALAATAHHMLDISAGALPDLVVGHGVLGRLVVRLLRCRNGAAPVVWEHNPARRVSGMDYQVLDPAVDTRRDYRSILDVSGDSRLLNTLISALGPGGQVVLGGFYAAPLSFDFAPAFQREVTLRIAAEWKPGDLAAVTALIDAGALSLAGLVSHVQPAASAPAAYRSAFDDPDCLKMVLNWSE